MSRKGLDLGSLNDFQPRQNAVAEVANGAQERFENGWERREAPKESQFTIRANADTIKRFKQLCRPAGGGRFTYGEMLEILVRNAERRE